MDDQFYIATITGDKKVENGLEIKKEDLKKIEKIKSLSGLATV
jgi:hypothetical protein